MLRTLVLALTFSTISFAAYADEQTPTAYLERLAAKGNPQAQDELAHRYATGFGPSCVTTQEGPGGRVLSRECDDVKEHVPPNPKKAVALFRKAAESGLADAQFELGNLYGFGVDGVLPQDKKQEVYWLRKAATQGQPYALGNLGFMYSKGQGVPRDLPIAYALLSIAKTGGYRTFGYVRELASTMSPQQIEEGKKLAREWRIGTPLPTTSKTGK